MERRANPVPGWQSECFDSQQRKICPIHPQIFLALKPTFQRCRSLGASTGRLENEIKTI